MPRGIPNSKQAKNSPVIVANAPEAVDLPVGRTERAPTKNSQVGEPQLVAVAERMPDPEKAAMLQFMEEKIRVRPIGSSDPKELVWEITINNRPELFKVGEDKVVARKYVDRMCLMKVTAYTQKETFNAEGEKQILNVPQTRLRYNFQVLEDPNPMGPAWLKATIGLPG